MSILRTSRSFFCDCSITEILKCPLPANFVPSKKEESNLTRENHEILDDFRLLSLLCSHDTWQDIFGSLSRLQPQIDESIGSRKFFPVFSVLWFSQVDEIVSSIEANYKSWQMLFSSDKTRKRPISRDSKYIVHIIQRIASILHWKPRKEALIVTRWQAGFILDEETRYRTLSDV